MSVLFVAEREGKAFADLVAVKVLRQRTKGDVARLLALRDGSRELAKLHHRHIVCVEEVGFVGEFIALVSPYVDGIDLLDWLEILREEAVGMPGRVKCEIIRSVAVALDAALNMRPRGADAPLGRIHRDIRPTNVIISRDGELKVVDFGTGFTILAGRIARGGALKKGIIKYISPRRREGKRGGPPADVYSLGITAVELFRGRWLRRLQSHNPAHDRYLAEVVARLKNLGMRTEEDELALRNLLLRMIAFDPDARPEASEVANTFRTLGDRARGPSLESFAHTHALPWMEEVTRETEPDLAGLTVTLLETGMTDDDVPTAEELPDTLKLKSHRAGNLWEETQEGWRQTDWEVPEQIVDPFYDEEETQESDAALPGAPSLEDLDDTGEHTPPTMQVVVEFEDTEHEAEALVFEQSPTDPTLARQYALEEPSPDDVPTVPREVPPEDLPPTGRTGSPGLTGGGLLLLIALAVGGMAVIGGLAVGILIALSQ
jgi:serine/threonine protein kinase